MVQLGSDDGLSVIDGLMVNWYSIGWLTAPRVSVAVMKTSTGPATLGMPEILPVVVFRTMPTGKLPALMANVSGRPCRPRRTESDCSRCSPCVQSGSVVVFIVGA